MVRRSRLLYAVLGFGAVVLVVFLVIITVGGPTPATQTHSDASFDPESAATAAPDAVIARGAELYAANCQVCHGDKNGVGKLPYVPSHGDDGHTWHHSDRNLVDIIMNGPGEMGEMMRMGVPEDAPRMPAWRDKLAEEEVKAILAYIKTFWSPERRRMQEQSPMMR